MEFRSTDFVNNREEVKARTVTVVKVHDYALVGIEEVKLNGRSKTVGDIRSNGQVRLNGRSGRDRICLWRDRGVEGGNQK